jgi:GTP-binding protein Era
MGFKSGFVTVIGKTNVGKSSLINEMIGEQVSIVVNKTQTTRKVARGIYTDNEAQIIFVDTPGLHKSHSKLGNTMNEAATSTLDDVDLILFVVDAKEKTLDRETIKIIEKHKIPTILIINKIDLIGKAKVASLIDEYKKIFDFKAIIPTSFKNGTNSDVIIPEIKNVLQEGP